MAGEVHLRSKRQLIEAFIDDSLPKIAAGGDVIAEFESYWTANKAQALTKLCAEENIQPEALEKLINNYTFANRQPRHQEIVDALAFKPKALERKSVLQRVADKIQDFIDTFIEGMGGSV